MLLGEQLEGEGLFCCHPGIVSKLFNLIIGIV